MPIDISVVVTTYKRPKMVRDLILSYQFQRYQNSELVILDDCVDDQETKQMVESFIQNDPRIRFIKHPVNLGYSKNFLQSLVEAQGKYIVTLGDDDIFLHPDVLGKYVEIFEKNPNVSFIYSNILQFNNQYEMDFVYRHFDKDTLFHTLEERLQKIWLKSCYIPGIGLRNDVDFLGLYAKEDWLFPQVELIGKILGTSQAYGFSEFLIGGRAHDDQLGFEAVKGKRIKKNERHASLELLEIFAKLREYYRGLGIECNLSDDFVKNFFIESHASILPTEKINTGNANLLRIFFAAVKKNKNILWNTRYMCYMILSIVLPRTVLILLKNRYKKYLLEKKWQREAKYFQQAVLKIGLT